MKSCQKSEVILIFSQNLLSGNNLRKVPMSEVICPFERKAIGSPQNLPMHECRQIGNLGGLAKTAISSSLRLDAKVEFLYFAGVQGELVAASHWGRKSLGRRAFVPAHERQFGACGNVFDRELAFLIRSGGIRMVEGQREASHPRMDVAVHRQAVGPTP